eukprot:TRINITY_DN30259_c0_g1_i3.p1 TRINITY_DN30259_c0_g1~~TRINITY_DN30259_c0_g1_i3.p1  ORF type:complete len:342 (+),score=48.87 TRINITY_DN30259_c0_g1_i3:64-1089(+)
MSDARGYTAGSAAVNADKTPQDIEEESEGRAFKRRRTEETKDTGIGSRFCIRVCDLAGDGVEVEVTHAMQGFDLMRMIGQMFPPDRPGMYDVVFKGSLIALDKTLGEHGVAEGDDVLAVFQAASAARIDLVDCFYGLCLLRGRGRDRLIFESFRDFTLPVTGDRMVRYMMKRPLPPGLQNLRFDAQYMYRAIAMENFPLPPGLQSLSFCHHFGQSVEKLVLPSGLQSLTFGHCFNQSMEGVALPSGLQILTFGRDFNQSMEKVLLPCGLQSLTFGSRFNQSMEKVALPPGLQNLTFGREFNQSMEKVALPSRLQSLTFGDNFKQSMENVALPLGLALTFGG